MSSSVAKKYSYRSSVGRSAGGSADVCIEYSADLSALTRLEVSPLNSQVTLQEKRLLVEVT